MWVDFSIKNDLTEEINLGCNAQPGLKYTTWVGVAVYKPRRACVHNIEASVGQVSIPADT